MNERKICESCGAKLPLYAFSQHKYVAKNGIEKIGYSHICKSCFNEIQREKRGSEYQRVSVSVNNFEYKYEREFKEIHPSRILDTTAAGINLIGTDEIFAQITDAKRTWISNYGRCVCLLENGKYKLMVGKGEGRSLKYSIPRNVFIDGICEEQRIVISAEEEVVRNFIINTDWANNTKIWHMWNDNQDLYYRKLYPVNEKQYAEIKRIYTENGFETEEDILRVCNDERFFHDGFNIKDYVPSVRGVGYHGSLYTNSNEYSYKRWNAMIQRCYNLPLQNSRWNAWKGCSVSKEFLNYSNFKIWWDSHFYKVNDERMDIDKDLICAGNKIYDPAMVSVVPKRINSLIIRPEAKNGLPLGVSFVDGKYTATVTLFGKSKVVGTFDNQDDAHEMYKDYKKKFIQKMATDLRSKIPYTVYERLMNFEITLDWLYRDVRKWISLFLLWEMLGKFRNAQYNTTRYLISIVENTPYLCIVFGIGIGEMYEK